MILVINKVDTVEKDKVLEFIDTYRKIYDFAEIIPTSALRGQNVDDVIDSIFKYLPYGASFMTRYDYRSAGACDLCGDHKRKSTSCVKR